MKVFLTNEDKTELEERLLSIQEQVNVLEERPIGGPDYSNEISALEKTDKEHSEQIKTNTESIKGLLSSTVDNANQIKKLEETDTEQDVKVTQLQNDLSMFAGRLSGLEKYDTELNSRVTDLEQSGGSGGNHTNTQSIVDVLSLPSENINKNAIYRLMTAKFVSNYYSEVGTWVCYCVDGLPEIAEPATKDMININAYYNIQDNEVYGYADDTLSAAGGIPVGWYPIGTLGQAFDIAWGGLTTDIEDVDDTAKVLLSKDYYIYQDGWCKIAIGFEKQPEFDIQWDGVVGDRFALDMSALGYPNGTYFVKVSDNILSVESVVGATITQSAERYIVVSEADLDTTTYAGAFIIDNGAVCVYSADDLNNALGLPTGYITNGVYFAYVVDVEYVNRLVAPTKITKIDEKFLPEVNVNVDINSLGLHRVATSGNYNDLYNKPSLSSYVTTSILNGKLNSYATTSYVYECVRSQLSDYVDVADVNAMITEAIGNAIGGSY